MQYVQSAILWLASNSTCAADCINWHCKHTWNCIFILHSSALCCSACAVLHVLNCVIPNHNTLLYM
jgi:hypothetical protein